MVFRIAVRWTVGLSLLLLIFGLARRDFTFAWFGSRVFGSFVIGLMMGVLAWARREATSSLTGDSRKRGR
jgi:hypothetical protein